jgi:hypothetical protein
MIEDQAKDVIAKLATLFPDWAAWAGGVRTPDTIKAWQSALMSQEFSDVDAVVNDWQFGRKKAPEAFERERLIYLLVEAARVLKNNRYAKLESERVRENATATPEQIQQRRSEYNRLAAEQGRMGQAMRKILLAEPKGKPKWEWTKEEEIAYVDNLNRVVAEYAKELKLPVPEPVPYPHIIREQAAKRQQQATQPEPQPAEEFYAWQS